MRRMLIRRPLASRPAARRQRCHAARQPARCWRTECSDERGEELKEELARLEGEQHNALKQRLTALFEGMDREHMKLLRRLLDERIKETYDGDAE